MASLYCFTSTGNSLYAARKMADALGGQVYPITYEPVTSEDDVIGFVYPVFFWNAPKIVRHFVSHIDIAHPNAYTFAVATYGGDAWGAVGEMRKHLTGAKLSYAAKLKTVENYVPYYKVNNTENVHQSADKKLHKIIQDLKNRQRNREGFYSIHNRFNQKIVFPGRRSDCDRKFKISAACTGCGTCVKACPVGNISISARLPVFAHHCEHCLSCLHCCPSKAIDYGKTLGKERYVHPGIGVKGIMKFRMTHIS